MRVWVLEVYKRGKWYIVPGEFRSPAQARLINSERPVGRFQAMVYRCRPYRLVPEKKQ